MQKVSQALIPLVIITVPNSARIEPLLKQLNSSSLFDVIQFPAVMYDGLNRKFSPNYKKQKVIYSRKLSNGEIGCAISHQMVQKAYMTINSPCVVLEDDARIPNLEIFELVVTRFLEKYSNDKSILSLVPWKHENKSPPSLDLAPDIVGLSGSTPTTVAYVITPKSMKEMSDSNSDFSFLPDWPPNSVKFYTTIHGVVTHGDSNTTSLIDSVGRKKTKRSQNLLKLTFLPFVLNRSLFTNIGEYYNICIKPSFTWRIDSFKIMNKISH
jgi:GR25 family glycosyltransferase involved in LPS biosynthesis